MTIYKCDVCWQAHDSATQPPCPQRVTHVVAAEPMTPRQVGTQIRALLLSLRGSGFTRDLSTDEMRRLALDYAGICWLAPGEMAPGCCCDWSEAAPSGPRERMERDRQEAFHGARIGWIRLMDPDELEKLRGVVEAEVRERAMIAERGEEKP